VALQERVTTLEKRIAEVVDLQAKNERGMDRLEAGLDRMEAQAAADREQAKADLEAFREALHRDTEAFKEASRRDTEAFKVRTEKYVEGFGAKVDRWIREAAADRETMARQWGDLANRLGTVTEDVAAPNIPRIARRYFGMATLDEFRVRDHRKRGSNTAEEREFDVVAWDAARFLVVEVKSQVNVRDAEALLSRLPDLVDFYPEAAARQVVPILASFSIHESVLTYLTRHGVYGMVMSGATMRLSNFQAVHAVRPEA
jgi:hypothetical protein